MVTGQIQLGVKKGSGAYLDRLPTQGFFYGGGVWETQKLSKVGLRFLFNSGSRLRWRRTRQAVGSNPARQHLILQTCGCGVAQSGRAQRKAEIRFKSYPVSFLQTICRWAAPYSAAPHSTLCLKLNRLSCPSALFYDITSKKRVRRNTNEQDKNSLCSRYHI